MPPIHRSPNHLRLRIRTATLALPLLLPAPSRAQPAWDSLATGTTASLRGLSVVDDRVAWASGTRGTVLRSVDGGDSWRADTVPGAGALDLRAIHARSALVAHVAATAGRIWRTTDGGRTWSLRYQGADTAVFLDAIAFADDRNGIALGDPLDGRFLLLVTRDGGETWAEAAGPSRPGAAPGEAAFAASGTSLVLRGPLAWLGTGGSVARVLRSADGGSTWDAVPSGVRARDGSGGVFSLAFADPLRGVAVGGDYLQPDSAAGTASFTTDGGRTWLPASRPPRGYRSGVALARLDGVPLAIAVGTSGSDLTVDGGETWQPLDDTPFNAVQFAPSGIAFAAGSRGRISRLDARRLVAATRR